MVCREIAMTTVVSQQRLIDETAGANQALFEHFLYARRRIKGPLVLINERVMHTNTAAATLVQSTDHAVLWEWASRAAATEDSRGSLLQLTSGQLVAARATPIEDRGLLVGVLLRLDPVEWRPAPGTRGAGPAEPRPDYGWASLTSSERSVAAIIAEGATNREAAARLFLSRHTIDFHLRQIFRKLGISSRVALARLVVQHSAVGSSPAPLS
jgi:DNA-binding CsgD family transcriptional regulator